MVRFKRAIPVGRLLGVTTDGVGMTDRRLDLFGALAAALRERIRADDLPAGAYLPSETELARDAGTKRYSIRKALTLLQEEGLIVSIPGRGWAVLGTDGGDSLPRYRQIAADIRAAIEAGRLPGGTVLPSEARLLAQHGVSRSTVRQALSLLESEGLITTRPGSGRSVRNQ